MTPHSLRIRRTVWAYVTRHPDATIREISTATRIHVMTVQAAIRNLEQAGYISCACDTHGRRIAHSRQVLVPLYEARRRKARPNAS